MLVALTPQVARECIRMVEPMGVLQVRHAHAACERMLATRPLVVIVGEELPPKELEDVRAVARDIGAQVVLLAEHPEAEERRGAVQAAILAAGQRRR